MRRRSLTRWHAAWSFTAVLLLNVTAIASTDRYGVDLDGRPVPLAQSNAPAIVLFFTASDCPIANRYEPEMLRLEHEFASSGVEFWWVYPNPGDTAEMIRHHLSQFAGSTHIIRDTQQSLVQIAHATVTPETAILVPANGALREVYNGRIDDRYISLGQERPRALRHELEDAIAAILAKRPIPEPGGPPVGCSIVPLQLRGHS
jgi:AhpC/TSA family